MENFTRAFTVSGNVITDSKPTKKAGNAGENIVTSLSFTFSSEWDDAIKSIVFKTPKNRLLTAQTITGSIAPIPQDALDSGGTLQFSLMGAFADSEQVIRTPTYGLDVESTLSILGGTPLATYTNVVLDCQLATQEAITAKDAAVLATERIETTDAEVKAAETVRQQGETGRNVAYGTAEAARDASYQIAEQNRNDAYNAAEQTRAGISSADHTRAETDHTTAASDHATATNDHTTASTDHAAIAPTIAEINDARGGKSSLNARLTSMETDTASIGQLISDTTYNAQWKIGTPTADPTTDTFTLVGHGFNNGDPVEFDANTGVLPTGILPHNSDALGGMYYNVINRTADTFQICATPGTTGTPVDITAAGTTGWRIRPANVVIVWPALNLDADKEYLIIIDGTTAKYTGDVGYYMTRSGLNDVAAFISGVVAPTWGSASVTIHNAFNYKFTRRLAWFNIKKIDTGLIAININSHLTGTNDKSASAIQDTCYGGFITYKTGNLTGISVYSNDSSKSNWRNGTRVIIWRRR